MNISKALLTAEIFRRDLSAIQHDISERRGNSH